ncbi:type I-E CRISPR-associated protein Cas6/Cse3/CasE [Actinotignum sp. GS-2025e]|uniref:type I-E CRISPR-associated protein Cas6/Cse3/CasE n=1 Tax=Actinotignum TaxID=1653174 RepID=UPI00254E0290|nr:type I-E CRISPR-associated protein Cas6/Cse3/CasE [Actinotignum timonense]MDK6907080.1 type I-E CRISPR-associated protein Cas6/Cse3/CasE [Actinotignum timonense]MDK8782088.1 type I-E CRISPR-associated protein Cas6/Cse3/CasE [Actinotignum timonense]
MADQHTSEPQPIFLTKVPVHTLLSRVALHKPERGWTLKDPQVRHRAIMALFPQTNAEHPRAEMGILFRLDHVPGDAPFFLIQSREPVPQLNLPHEAATKEVELKELPAGTPVSFRIAINAIQRIGTGGTRSIPLDGEEPAPGIPSLSEWLSAKLSPALTNTEIIDARREVLTTGSGKDKQRAVQIDTINGVATVGDSGALLTAQTNGVGRAKSYGCGLLSIQALS